MLNKLWSKVKNIDLAKIMDISNVRNDLYGDKKIIQSPSPTSESADEFKIIE
jgi:hypothetical protein